MQKKMQVGFFFPTRQDKIYRLINYEGSTLSYAPASKTEKFKSPGASNWDFRLLEAVI